MKKHISMRDLIKKESMYIGCWESKIDVLGKFFNIYISQSEFESEKAPYSNEEYWKENKKQMSSLLKQMKNVHILFAVYDIDGYDGRAWVLFRQGGKLYEVYGSHCSCYGLEDQWEPEETSLDVLYSRLKNGTFAINSFKQEVCEFLEISMESLK